MNTYDKELPYTYSLGPKGQEILLDFREKSIAGNVNVYRRHINLMDENSPHNSRFGPSGHPYTYFSCWDFSAMYCYCEAEEMPLTPGIVWERKSTKYKKSLLLEANGVSFKQIQWLYYIEATECIDQNGNKVVLEHGFHRGEKRFMGFLPDGYMQKNGRHYFFEFQGCFWHPGCCVPNEKLHPGWEQRQSRTEEKHAYLGSQGNLRIMRECEWDRMLRVIEKPVTTMGRILHTDTEDTLLKAILDNEVFGFATVDVTTPDEIIEREKDFLFPYLFVRQSITEEMICPYMKEKLTEQQRKHTKETIIQCYNAKDHLLMTPLIRYYHSRGLIISNIRKFVQYVPGRPFKSFVQSCYENRVEATKAGDKTRSNTIKNVANSGYGKCSERVADHKRVEIYWDEDKVATQEAKPQFVDYKEFVDENNDLEAWEITMRKRSITDDKPVHLSCAILQHSKLLFLR